MIKCLGITHRHCFEKDININQLDMSKYKWFWVDFSIPTDDEIKHLSDTFKFHPLAIEDCIHRLQRPKLDYYDGHTFYVTHILREGDKEIIKEELDFFIGKNFLVTFHHHDSIEVNQVWNELSNHKDVEKWDVLYTFYQILDKVVDDYFPLIYKIEDSLDKIESNTQNKSANHLMNELFDVRYTLLSLMHTVNPMRDLLYRMLGSRHLNEIRHRKEYFSDIYDHLLKLSEMIAANRENTNDIRDSYLSLNSHQTNNIMKVLTIITSIFAPLTFIVGVYGMNFQNMPELTWRYGYFICLGIMGVMGISMYVWFAKKGWFK